MTRCPLIFAIVLATLIVAVAPARQAVSDPKATALAAVDRNADEIAKVGDAIFSFAELGMQEVETAALSARLLRELGYTVETGVSGIPTAIQATYGSGRPVIAIHVEYDAVPSGSQASGVTERREIVAGAPGHAEGHHANAALWIGAAFAVKQAIDTHPLAGTIKLFSVQSPSSNDSGDVTWTVPHGRITFPSNVPGVPFHH